MGFTLSLRMEESLKNRALSCSLYMVTSDILRLSYTLKHRVNPNNIICFLPPLSTLQLLVTISSRTGIKAILYYVSLRKNQTYIRVSYSSDGKGYDRLSWVNRSCHLFFSQTLETGELVLERTRGKQSTSLRTHSPCVPLHCRLYCLTVEQPFFYLFT